jgi:mRNA-degrading endonuclease RelE of RelBE toxin-antitoxin system
MYAVAFTPSARGDILFLPKRQQVAALNGIQRHLIMEPTVPTRNRKKLRPNQSAEWELRIGNVRVFYDADETARVVEIKVVGQKQGNELFVRGKKYTL